MKKLLTAIALTIALPAVANAQAQPAPATPTADPHAQHAQQGQMDHSKMDHGKMDHSKMDHSCCKKGADGKMECAMHDKSGADSAHQGHSGH